MYTAKEIKNEFGGGSKIKVGIHTACKLASVVVGDNFVDFNYESAEGSVHNKRVWFPELSKVYVRENETDQQALERSRKEALAHIVKHMHIFLDKETVDTFSAPDFKSFVLNASRLLEEHKDSSKINLKLIPDSKLEYSTFGRYPDYIEEYEEGKEPTLQFTSWEIQNRVNPYKNSENSSSANEEGQNKLNSII